MDTDVDVIKPLDRLLQYDAVAGFESKQTTMTGLMASQKEQNLFVEFLHDYDGSHFKRPYGFYDTTTNVKRITDICLENGFVPNNDFQTIQGLVLFPSEYFSPKDLTTRKVKLTNNTFTS